MGEACIDFVNHISIPVGRKHLLVCKCSQHCLRILIVPCSYICCLDGMFICRPQCTIRKTCSFFLCVRYHSVITILRCSHLTLLLFQVFIFLGKTESNHKNVLGSRIRGRNCAGSDSRQLAGHCWTFLCFMANKDNIRMGNAARNREISRFPSGR